MKFPQFLLVATVSSAICHFNFAMAQDGEAAGNASVDAKLDSKPELQAASDPSGDQAPLEEPIAKAIPIDEKPVTAEPKEAEPKEAEPKEAEPKQAEPKQAEEHQQGPTVQVENLQTAAGPIDPKTVKILAPFPAKPLAPIPIGWRLDANNTAPTFSRKVELAQDASVVLKIRPQVLVPDADGAAVFSIQEPGYDPAFGYQQSQTVSHILTNSIRQLDDDSKAIGNAIERLEQLLGSLPSPKARPGPPLSNTKLTDKR